MRAGRLSSQITIQRHVTGQDEIGQPINTTETVAVVWADIRHTSGMEAIKADATTSVVKASMRIRYRSDITAAMVVLHESATYEIRAVLPDAGRVYVDLVCESVT